MSHRYEIGDKVRVWPVFKRPTGTIVSEVEGGKYSVQYIYEDGSSITEDFSAKDLTLMSRHAASYKVTCECGSHTDGHSHWCPKFEFGKE